MGKLKMLKGKKMSDENKEQLRIVKWIRDGNYGFKSQGIESQDELLEAAGRLMDKAYSHDIVGDCVFKASNGRHYVGTVEFVLSECSKDYMSELLEENDE